MPGVNELYTAYFYDQLAKLWVEKMCNRSVGMNKIWPKEKPKRIYLQKISNVKPADYYEQLKRDRLEKRKVRKRLAQKKYYEKNRALEIKKRLDRYYKLKKAA